jgi:hypothetical protein
LDQALGMQTGTGKKNKETPNKLPEAVLELVANIFLKHVRRDPVLLINRFF